MKYDFDRVHDRKNTDSAKWNMISSVFGGDDVIPMWVADMDFPAAEPVIGALKERAGHPFYGYVRLGPGVTEAIVERMQKKFGWKIEPEWIVFTPGVIPALGAAVRSLARPGDGIILQEPVYFPFFSAVESSGCHIVNNGLKLVDGRYEMDFEGLESIIKPQPGMHSGPGRVKAVILCNPQNPVGRLWERDELVRMGETVIRNGAVVISDEIHCEILFRGYRHTPFGSISEEFQQNSIICMSPSKTFNLAGLEISTIIIPNEKLRKEFNNARSVIQPGPNLFGYAALEAAYRYGDEWLEQVLDYLQANLDYMTAYFKEKIPRIRIIQPQGTYLIWLDCRELGMDKESLSAFMREKAKVGMNDGHVFGESGSGFQRMNIACPRSLLEEALSRIEKAVNSL